MLHDFKDGLTLVAIAVMFAAPITVLAWLCTPSNNQDDQRK